MPVEHISVLRVWVFFFVFAYVCGMCYTVFRNKFVTNDKNGGYTE